MPVSTVHFLLICIWLGLVLAESVIEFHSDAPEDLKVTARLHALIDTWLEIPVVTGVLATGVWLAWERWPLPTWMWAKVALGLVAISANFYCAGLVFARWHNVADPKAVVAFSSRVRWTWWAVPIGLAAFLLGLAKPNWG